MNDSTSEIGKRVKERRLELNLTQTNIKELTGISAGNISDIEKGNRLPSTPTLLQLSKVLKCSIDFLLTGISPMNEKEGLPDITDEGLRLLELFYTLPEDERNELLLIAELKFKKIKKGYTAKSFHLDEENPSSNIA